MKRLKPVAAKMSENLTLADVVEWSLKEGIAALHDPISGLHNSVDAPEQMIEDLAGIIALMRQPQEPKYWPEAAKRPNKFPQFVQNRACSGVHICDSIDACTAREALENLLVEACKMRKLTDCCAPSVQKAIERAEKVLGIK